MKKQQIILIAGAAALLIVLFLFGRTVPNQKNNAPLAADTTHNEHDGHDHSGHDHSGHDHSSHFTIQTLLQPATAQLSADRQAYLTSLQSAVVRGDVKDQQIHVYHQLASFWRDTVLSVPIFSYYTAEASKLENSKKSLTFAARLFLEKVRGTEDPAAKSWMAGQTKELFERLLVLDPNNDSAKIGLGSCYIFGSPAADPQMVMQGIQKILEVARRDSTNMYAQLMLGIGGVVSGQLDKAIERLLKVVKNEPNNLEALVHLAEAYEQKSDKVNAKKWYNESKKFITNAAVLKVIDQRIKSLQ